MSDNRILQKFIGRQGSDEVDGREITDEELIENHTCFGWLRGIRDRAIAIEFRKKSGHILAVQSAFITKLEFEPATGIHVHTASGQIVKILGRHLNSEVKPNLRLFQGMTRFRVPWLQETERSAQLQADERNVIVESIQW